MTKLVLFNKPFNVLSQFTDGSGRVVLKDYIDDADVHPAGRLDYDSEGLLVLTDSGPLQHKISHPSQHMSKTYWAQVEGAPSLDALLPLTEGIELKDGPCIPIKVALIEQPHMLWPRQPPIRQRRHIPTQWLSLTLAEGRNRQVRRMCAAVGFPVLRLIRYRIGSWTLDGLEPGEWRYISL